jgi:hypothetical protein
VAGKIFSLPGGRQGNGSKTVIAKTLMIELPNLHAP